LLAALRADQPNSPGALYLLLRWPPEGGIYAPLATLLPKRSPDELGVTARSLFSAVHGMVALGLEQKLIAVPISILRDEIATIVKATIKGLN
jgi:hypothetical protein